MNYPELSRGIRDRKLADIAGTGANVVISQCPGCRSYLSSGLDKRRKALHPVSLLRRAYEDTIDQS